METKAKKTTQEERLDYLVEEFKVDSAECKDQIPVCGSLWHICGR